MLDENKIKNQITKLEIIAGMFIDEITMLKRELGGVVPKSSPQKGLSETEKIKILAKRQKTRLGTK
jgi:hypothetical protein